MTSVVLVLASLPLLYYTFALVAVRRFQRRPHAGKAATDEPEGFAPPVSVLKPMRGLDRRTREHLSSFCHQDYGEYEILFAVADGNDPAIPVIEQLMREFPERAIRLIVGGAAAGPSNKVGKLCTLAREARHDLLVVSDSDVAVPPGYLRAVVAAFRDPAVGAATCLYRGAPVGGLWADLEALGISTDFIPGVIVAHAVEGLSFTLGATMATTKGHLLEIGGFEALVEMCADDFELGRRIADRGHRVELAGSTVSTECAPGRFGDFFRHELRWAITMRQSRPWGYAGRAVVTQGLPWALGAVAVAPNAIGAAYLIAYAILRLLIAWQAGVLCLQDGTIRRRWWLIPVRDAIAFVVSVASFCSNRITWRGQSFDLRGGKLIPRPGNGERDIDELSRSQYAR